MNINDFNIYHWDTNTLKEHISNKKLILNIDLIQYFSYRGYTEKLKFLLDTYFCTNRDIAASLINEQFDKEDFHAKKHQVISTTKNLECVELLLKSKLFEVTVELLLDCIDKQVKGIYELDRFKVYLEYAPKAVRNDKSVEIEIINNGLLSFAEEFFNPYDQNVEKKTTKELEEILEQLTKINHGDLIRLLINRYETQLKKDSCESSIHIACIHGRKNALQALLYGLNKRYQHKYEKDEKDESNEDESDEEDQEDQEEIENTHDSLEFYMMSNGLSEGLRLAVQHNNLNILEFVQRFSSVENGYWPKNLLVHAVKSGSMVCVVYVMGLGFEMNYRCLISAVQYSNKEDKDDTKVLEFLIDQGCPLHINVFKYVGKNSKCFEMLYKYWFKTYRNCTEIHKRFPSVLSSSKQSVSEKN